MSYRYQRYNNNIWTPNCSATYSAPTAPTDTPSVCTVTTQVATTPQVPTGISNTPVPTKVYPAKAPDTSGAPNTLVLVQFDKLLTDNNAILKNLNSCFTDLNITDDKETIMRSLEELKNTINNYEQNIDKLLEANFYTNKTTTSSSSYGGKKITIEVFDENGKLVSKKEYSYDNEGNIIEVVKTTYYEDYEIIEIFNHKDQLIHEASIRINGSKKHDFYYNEDGSLKGYTGKSYDSETGNYSLVLNGCDWEGNPLVDKNGTPIKERQEEYDSEGNLRNCYFGWNEIKIEAAYFEEYHDGTICYYDKDNKLVLKINPNNEFGTLYEYYVDGKLSSAVTKNLYNGNIMETDEFQYFDDGSTIRTLTQYQDNGEKTIQIVYSDPNGQKTKEIKETYNAEGILMARETTEYNVEDDNGPRIAQKPRMGMDWWN